MDFQSETQNGMHFLQELLFHMIDNGVEHYRVPCMDMPIDLSIFPVQTVRFCKISKVVELFSEQLGRDSKAREFAFYDQGTDAEYRFTVESDAEGLDIYMEGRVEGI